MCPICHIRIQIHNWRVTISFTRLICRILILCSSQRTLITHMQKLPFSHLCCTYNRQPLKNYKRGNLFGKMLNVLFFHLYSRHHHNLCEMGSGNKEIKIYIHSVAATHIDEASYPHLLRWHDIQLQKRRENSPFNPRTLVFSLHNLSLCALYNLLVQNSTFLPS